MCPSEPLLGVTVEVEFDPVYQKWFVWEPGGIFRRRKLITSSENRDAAIGKARAAIVEGRLAHSEFVKI